ncbi:MAG: translin family protein [Methanothrix sp.]|uniref:Translin n=1 Tax=Methanothrix thermoacetophila (strain DSM 6194 / JCM 14653 / NBRC 101360 / PT) TaxID=349307 RepID=A0B631_METTP|nr:MULTISPECIES: translin family protein [Methanothrix]ABK14155.1 Translin [Methanothrix thermoacetophila PT]MBC7079746.1 translin family protein [Methanothrix sp.]NPU87821.1 translin family protein [Methanothrix sp.]
MHPKEESNRSDLDDLIDALLKHFDEKDAAREEALRLSRIVIRLSSTAIRATHRRERREAESLLKDAREHLTTIKDLLVEHQDVRYSGFVDDAEQEFVEASVLYSLIFEGRMPTHEDLEVDPVSYLSGLGDLTGELRRNILELIRNGRPEDGEVLLEIMEEIYHMLMRFDYPDALMRGLRRKTDLTRSMIERTRGDITNALQIQSLERHLALLEDKLKGLYSKL